MSTKRVLKLLERISDDKKRVHRTALAYCHDKCELVNGSMNLVFTKNGLNKPFSELDEFRPLLERVSVIQTSDRIVDEMFEIDEDIKKLKSYIDAGYLVSPDKVVEGKENTIMEAKVLCDNSKNYFLIDGKEMDMFDKNFSVCRLRTFVDKSDADKDLTQDDIKSMKFEIEKIRLLMEEGRTINFFQIDKDIEGSKGIRPLLDQLDPDFYDPALLIKNQLGKIYDVFDQKGEYAKKAKLFYKFICEMVPRLLENVKQNCKDVNTDFKSRLQEELARIEEDEKYEVQYVERRYNNNKQGLLGGIFGAKSGMSKNEKNAQLDEIKQRYDRIRSTLEKNLRDVVEGEKKKIDETLEIVFKIERILNDKTVGYKFRPV